MAKASAAMPDDLNTIPGTYKVERRVSSYKLSSHLHTNAVAHVPFHLFLQVVVIAVMQQKTEDIP